MSDWTGGPLSASVRRRLRRRKILRAMVPTLHPCEEKWRERAFGGHVCQPIIIQPDGQAVAAVWTRNPDRAAGQP
jgi:hypothetical protein